VSDSRRNHLSRIRRAAGVVELRLRLGRALRAFPTALTLALAVVAGTLAAHKALPEHLAEHRARQIVIAAGLLVLATVIVSMLRRLPPGAGTMALDRHHGLHDRLTNALSFDALPRDKRSPLMEVAIDDACERAAGLRPADAAPLPVPRDLAASFAVALGLLAIALLEVRTPHRETPVAQTIDALTMSPDDIELFKDAAKALDRQDQSPEMKAAVERFNQLIEDIANKRLDRTEAFRRMEAIERELLKGAEADLKALEEALKETGAELKKSDLAKDVGESLEKKDFEKAKKDLKELAEKLRDKKKLNKAELERLRKALAEAASRRKEALAAINEKREEAREQLLKQKQKSSAESERKAEEERLLKKKERELERLDRDAEQKERTGRQLDRLDRELAKAAEDLMRDLGLSADDLEQAAEDINRMQQEEMSEKEKEELRQRMEELRELLRQQGQSGKQRMARMLRFGKRARGGQSGGGQQQGQGQDGQGEEQEGQDGQDGQGQQGKGGQGQGQGQQWVLGPGGKKILLPGGQGQDGQGSSQGNGGEGNQPGGEGAGSGRGGEIAGKRSDPKMGTQDVQAQGLETQQGPSNSEVILSAAERGFKGTGYKKVFTQYHTVAEQQINKDQIPDGYRFYVNRYFQLIRPRE
jgi:hypothetical protein